MTKNYQIIWQQSDENKMNIFEKELKKINRKLEIKIYTKRLMYIGAILLLVGASILYDFDGEEVMGIILFFYSIILTVSALI
jgi:Na+/phosphate symporter